MCEFRWLDAALDKLANIDVAVAPPDRDRMAAGVEAFNASLAAGPFGIGESRSADRRVAFPPLLCVYFRFDEARRRVWVTDVRRYG